MSSLMLYAVDLVAVVVLVLALYFPRHRRRDLVVAYLLVNVGVLAVSSALASSTVAAGLGLGLFGVLSIIRLRSLELEQHEVAYYFAALALGLLGGLGSTTGWLGLAGSVLVVGVMAVADHPRFLARVSHETRSVMLDGALTDHLALVARLETLLGGTVHAVSVRKLDLVNDTTLVDVRFSAGPRPAPSSGPGMPSSRTALLQGAAR
ncbi:DUF4956 domain-containing protein [Myceligenerans salitolerans]|uniref:DUF4956 domain-containing protein n=1 Tax=Myceligenerans salitolerans TaxID=1230528 RepID=A0ABS3IDI6_9MICO|nr:DUF4956 domain-containing protein [Myceligenerans salitolerans]MBO0611092.1 DUF4956 domain-containing protein [Myceligenerans salitolerans]